MIDPAERVLRQLLDPDFLAAEAERLADAALAREQAQVSDRVVPRLEETQEIGADGSGRAEKAFGL